MWQTPTSRRTIFILTGGSEVHGLLNPFIICFQPQLTPRVGGPDGPPFYATYIFTFVRISINRSWFWMKNRNYCGVRYTVYERKIITITTNTINYELYPESVSGERKSQDSPFRFTLFRFTLSVCTLMPSGEDLSKWDNLW